MRSIEAIQHYTCVICQAIFFLHHQMMFFPSAFGQTRSHDVQDGIAKCDVTLDRTSACLIAVQQTPPQLVSESYSTCLSLVSPSRHWQSYLVLAPCPLDLREMIDSVPCYFDEMRRGEDIRIRGLTYQSGGLSREHKDQLLIRRDWWFEIWRPRLEKRDTETGH